jgi:diaminopimelate epimerase
LIVQFSKYHGTGNDFILIDGRIQDTSWIGSVQISRLCHRRFGIGADGLIVLEEAQDADFRMRYFNSDGEEGTMCGNGGRCITLFAAKLGIVSQKTLFEGIDGLHRASFLPDHRIRLQLKDVDGISRLEDGYLVDTGSPHFVKFVPEVDSLDVEKLGREIRNQPRFGTDGVNVNFVAQSGAPDNIVVRTYERGVEMETFSCGTGVTASAICSSLHFGNDIFSYEIGTRGGLLQVEFNPIQPGHFTEVFLMGHATEVFEGNFKVES